MMMKMMMMMPTMMMMGLTTTATTSKVLAAAATIDDSSKADPYAAHWELYPRSYAVSRVPPEFAHHELLQFPDGKMDGDLSKAVWSAVPFSEPFGDIRGDDNDDRNDDDDTRITPVPETRFKALYDDTHLYIGAILHPSPGMATQAHFERRNAPIYQRDSDFEVFIDGTSSTTMSNNNHMYKELEVNAINTVWNLLLDKPYDDGGREHSGRVAAPGEADYYEVYGQRTATKIISGRINDIDTDNNNHNTETGALWSVEMALSFRDLQATTATSTRRDGEGDGENENENSSSNTSPVSIKPPTRGTFWRINFSRVERQGAINWTWQPQNVCWNAAQERYSGVVAMHRPDSWGYLHFVDHDNEPVFLVPRDPTWPAKLTAMTVYYAMHYYQQQSESGRYTNEVADLILPAAIVEPFGIRIDLLPNSNNNNEKNENDGGGFLVTVTSKSDNSDSKTSVTVRDDRLLTVLHSPDESNGDNDNNVDEPSLLVTAF